MNLLRNIEPGSFLAAILVTVAGITVGFAIVLSVLLTLHCSHETRRITAVISLTGGMLIGLLASLILSVSGIDRILLILFWGYAITLFRDINSLLYGDSGAFHRILVLVVGGTIASAVLPPLLGLDQ